MKLRLLAIALTIVGLICIAQQGRAQLTMTGVGGGFGGVAAIFSVTWEAGQNEASGGTTITYNCGSSCAFGTAGTRTVVAVVVGSRMATVNQPTSVTIGGQAATAASGCLAQVSGTNGANISIWYFAGSAAGTSGNVVVNWGAAAARTGISVYNIQTATPTPSACSIGSLSVASATIAVPSGGGGMAGNFYQNVTSAPTWSSATPSIGDYAVNPGGSSTFTTATLSGTGSQTPTVSGTSGSNVFTVAAWGP